MARAADIEQKQAVISEYLQTVAQLTARIALGEQQFGIAAAEAHRAIDDGRLEETTEVCSWLIDIDRFERLQRG